MPEMPEAEAEQGSRNGSRALSARRPRCWNTLFGSRRRAGRFAPAPTVCSMASTLLFFCLPPARTWLTAELTGRPPRQRAAPPGQRGCRFGQTAASSSIVGEPAATPMRTAASCGSRCRSAGRDDMQSWWHTVRPPRVPFSRLPTKTARRVARVTARQWEWSFDRQRAFSFFRRWVQLRADGFLFVEPPGS